MLDALDSAYQSVIANRSTPGVVAEEWWKCQAQSGKVSLESLIINGFSRIEDGRDGVDSGHLETRLKAAPGSNYRLKLKDFIDLKAYGAP